MATELPILDRILRKPVVLEITGLGETQLDAAEARGEFPRRVRPTEGGRAVGWLESEVRAWLAARLAAREKDGVPGRRAYEGADRRPEDWREKARKRRQVSK